VNVDLIRDLYQQSCLQTDYRNTADLELSDFDITVYTKLVIQEVAKICNAETNAMLEMAARNEPAYQRRSDMAFGSVASSGRILQNVYAKFGIENET